MLRAVARAHRDLRAQHQRNRVRAAEHVTSLTDLVEHLVGGNPHEVWVHEFNHRTEAAIEGHTAAKTSECVFTNRCSQNAVRVLLNKSLGGAVGTTL